MQTVQFRDGVGVGSVPAPTGRREVRDGLDWVVHTRRLRARPGQVWAALTDRRLTPRWLGSSRPLPDDAAGDQPPRFAFEAEELLPLVYRLDRVEEGRGFALTVHDPSACDPWRLEVELDLDPAGGTLLTVAQTVTSTAVVPSAAAACEFFLDRLAGFLERRDPSGPDYDEYFLEHATHYRRMFPLQRRRAPV